MYIYYIQCRIDDYVNWSLSMENACCQLIVSVQMRTMATSASFAPGMRA